MFIVAFVLFFMVAGAVSTNYLLPVMFLTPNSNNLPSVNYVLSKFSLSNPEYNVIITNDNQKKEEDVYSEILVYNLRLKRVNFIQWELDSVIDFTKFDDAKLSTIQSELSFKSLSEYQKKLSKDINKNNYFAQDERARYFSKSKKDPIKSLNLKKFKSIKIGDTFVQIYRILGSADETRQQIVNEKYNSINYATGQLSESVYYFGGESDINFIALGYNRNVTKIENVLENNDVIVTSAKIVRNDNSIEDLYPLK